MTDERTDLETLAARLDAVERALTDGERAAPRNGSPSRAGSPDDSDPERASLREEIGELERRIEALAAELDAVRGLFGGVEAVNESVERRADLALAAAERMAAERDGDDLLVERLPSDPSNESDARGDSAAFADAGDAESGDTGNGGAGNAGEEGDSATLAARLREAL